MSSIEPELFFSNFSCAEDAKNVTTYRTSFPDLVESLAEDKHEERDEKNGSAINFSDYKGKARLRKNIVAVCAVVLDIDAISVDGLSALREHLKGFRSICYSTFSYQPGTPKVRVIVPMKKAIRADQYRGYALRLISLLNVQYDKVSLDPNQIYYLPSRPIGKDPGHFLDPVVDAEFLDFEALPHVAEPEKLKGTSKNDADDRNYYSLATQAQETMYPDGLVFVNGDFYCYEEGYWKSLPVLSMKQKFSRKESPLHGTLASPAAMNNLIDALKAHAHVDSFPAATPLTVAVANGVVHLDTGKRSEQSPKHWLRNRLEIEYDPSAKCPRWLQFLEDVFLPDADKVEKIEFLQELMGYIMIPSAEHHVMAWFIGHGSNGKSVAIDLMQELLGASNFSSVPLHRLGRPFTNAVLQNKLANFCAEISSKCGVEEGAIKEIVGGDMIYAEKKGKDGFSYKPYARIIAAGNSLPAISDTSNGFFRRLTILHFNRRLTDEEKDLEIGAKLKKELAGIFVWAMAGLHRLRRNGRFTAVPSSQLSVASYHIDSSPVASFMQTAARIGTGNRMRSTAFYNAFKTYCVGNGYLPVIASSKFGSELARLGVVSKKSNGHNYYYVELRPGQLPDTSGQAAKTRPKRTDLMAEMGDVEDCKDLEEIHE